MIALDLKKTESSKTTQEKQQNVLITIKILWRPLLESNPPHSAILIPNVKIQLS